MNNSFQKECIEKFIKELKSKYYDISIGYIYNENEDLFDIWHNNKDLQFSNKDFLKFVGKLLKEVIYSQGIYNVSFGYDYTKTTNDEISYVVQSKVILETNPIIKISLNNDLKGFLSNDSTSIIRKESFFDIGDNTKVYYSKEDVSKYNYGSNCFDKDKKSTVVINTNLINTWEEELVA